MSDKTGIAWTDMTWNPVTGCSKVSEGCRNCYAERVWPRLAGNQGRYFGRKFSEVRIHPETLSEPFRKMRPRKIFVNSMSDLFHENLSRDDMDEIFATMMATPRHSFQVLTKRPKRMLEYVSSLEQDVGRLTGRVLERMAESGRPLSTPQESRWPFPNIWMGVTTEDQKSFDERIPLLLATPATVRWISVEPMVGPVTLPEDVLHSGKLHWVVIGGESGKNSRKMEMEWARNLIQQCREGNISVFMKQLGSSYYPLKVKHPHGADVDEWPEDIAIREFPKTV